MWKYKCSNEVVHAEQFWFLLYITAASRRISSVLLYKLLVDYTQNNTIEYNSIQKLQKNKFTENDAHSSQPSITSFTVAFLLEVIRWVYFHALKLVKTTLYSDLSEVLSKCT